MYLVTAPRFLGYSFNPVSFWYIYNKRKELKAMILEVNNTFGERRIYFLRDTGPNSVPNATSLTNSARAKSQELDIPDMSGFSQAATTRFSSSWAKDFHVSPFNSRKGAYSVSAENPLGKGKINNTITLSSSKGHPKLVARVFSTGDSIDPSEMGIWGICRFVAAWWWVGFMTFPRILREAAKLFLRRKLHIWYRPEVLQDSLGRQATEDEK